MESPKSGQKRPSLGDETKQEEPLIKRQRTATLKPELGVATAPPVAGSTELPSATAGVNVNSEANFAREELQRSIAIALQHVGFNSTSQEALESLTSATETCR